MVAHLINIDDAFAATVARGLGLPKMPKAATPAVKPRQDLPVSDALSILKNAPATFKGRKLGVLVTDGADAALLTALEDAVKTAEGVIELIGPAITGVTTSDGTLVPVQHKIDGGPSVLFDAVAILASEEGIAALLKLPAARDFVADAYAHYKFVGFTEPAAALFAKAGLEPELDAGFVRLKRTEDAAALLTRCRDLRFWNRADAA